MKNLSISHSPNFRFGNCALIAIGSAFNLKLNFLELMCKHNKIRYKRGMTDSNIKKLINILSDLFDYQIRLIPGFMLKFNEIHFNKNKIYIIAIEEHLFTLKKGRISDSFLYRYSEKIQYQPIHYFYELTEKFLFTKKIKLL